METTLLARPKALLVGEHSNRLPIWRHNMPSAAWQLLWWMICKMDAAGEIHDGWRIRAAKEMKKDRTWIGRCAEHLVKRELIYTTPGARYAKVIVKNLVG